MATYGNNVVQTVYLVLFSQGYEFPKLHWSTKLSCCLGDFVFNSAYLVAVEVKLKSAMLTHCQQHKVY